MGTAAREWVLEHYMDRLVLGRTVDYYKSLLEPATEEMTDQEATAVV
jgi:hypothetical protein